MRSKIKRVIINPLAFLNIMETNTAWRVTSGIPKDARLCGFTTDPQTQNLILFIEHPSFDEIDVQNEVASLLTLEVRKVQ